MPRDLYILQKQIVAVMFLLLITLSGCVPVDSASDGLPTDAEVIIEAVDPLPLADALPPLSLAIPEIGLEVAVAPMGWRITERAGVQTTVWEIPLAEAGWHVNSAGAGAAGNTVLSGHQAVGDAPFAPLALGDVEIGQQIFLADESGAIFVYSVVEITEPIPIAGATADDRARAEAYFAGTENAQLTLATGWPDFSTTHYLFVVAEFSGRVGS